jgi:hypothetical protein
MGLVLCGCASAIVTNEERLVTVPARADGCAIEHVPDGTLSAAFYQRWETVGRIEVHALHGYDANAPASVELVRPSACALGGTAVAVDTEATEAAADGGAIWTYLVVRPVAGVDDHRGVSPGAVVPAW